MNANVMPILQRAAALFQSGQFAACLTASEEALRATPGHPEALHMKALALGRLGRVDEAMPFFDDAAARHPQRHAILANKGNALRAAARLQEAIAAYSASVAAKPKFAVGWIGLGDAYRETKNAEKAAAAYQKGLALEPKNPNLLNNFGLLLVADGHREEAIERFSAALAVQPEMVSALVNRGAALRFAGRIEEALADHLRAEKLAPQNPEAQYQLANSLRQAGRLADAERAYVAALRIAPERVDVHRDLARMLWEMGESSRFLSALDQAINVRPDPALLTLKGELSYRAGQTTLAEDAAKKAISIDSENAAALRLIGRLRRHERDYAAARDAFEKSLETSPSDFETLHDFAESLMAQGDIARTLQLLARTPPCEHLQKHIALKTLAMRIAGDQGYRRYYDYDRLTKKIMIEPPEGYASLQAFNDDLVKAIMPLHATTAQPLDQTLYGGTQSFGRLWDEPHPAIQALKRRLLEAAAAYVAALPDDPEHPFLARKSTKLKCAGAWSVVLSSGGGHIDHFHPEGWISASYYVRVPEEVKKADKAGYLRLGKPPLDGIDLEAERWVKPEEGAVVFFPSYMWHGVEKFESATPRITAPFDLAPALSSR